MGLQESGIFRRKKPFHRAFLQLPNSSYKNYQKLSKQQLCVPCRKQAGPGIRRGL